MREVGTEYDSFHLRTERDYLWDLASHSAEYLGSSVSALSEHHARFMFHVDQVRSALVGCGEEVVVGDELMDLFLLLSKTGVHDSPLGLGRLELGLVEHDHLEQDGVGRRWAWWGTHGYSCGVLGKLKNERLRTPSSVLVHFPSTPSPPL